MVCGEEGRGALENESGRENMISKRSDRKQRERERMNE